MPIQLRIARNPDPKKKGTPVEWSATVIVDSEPRVWRIGFGRSRDDAMGHMLRANLGHFGVTSIEDEDCNARDEDLTATWCIP